MSDGRVLHLIGNAHIDPVWLWQWQEGYQEIRATFWSAVHRLAEYPEFVFTATSVGYLEWVEESDPELFERIRRHIAEGRWHVVGGWWVEPDCNLPAGESFVRQALYAQRYLHDRFGVTSTVGCNVDPFGHNAMLPQLLRRSGMDSYVFLRPQPHELALHRQTFWWQSPDGSRVLAYRIPHEYCSPGQDLGAHVDRAVAVLSEEDTQAMVFYGVGNHGGGPTRANLDSIRELDATRPGIRARCGSPRGYFDAVLGNGAAAYPVHAGELQHHAVGCYSAHSGIKRWNRRAENALQVAERWAAVAQAVTGLAYPLAELTAAWKLVLFNQFHDILAGTSIDAAYDDARDQLGEACARADRVANRSRQVLSRQIDIPHAPGSTPVVVFNPHAWPVDSVVELEFGGHPAPLGERLTDERGQPVAVQRIRSQAVVAGRRRLAFRAQLPPLGYRTYHVLEGAAADAPELVADGAGLENEHLRVVVDPATGWLSSLVDKATGADLVPESPGPHAVVLEDLSDTWSHGVERYDRPVGEFRCESVRLAEHGPVRAVLRVESRYGGSVLAEELVLMAGARHLEVRVWLDWQERLKLLKLRFPTALRDPSASYEIPYGYLVRPTDGAEEPGHTWVDVSGLLGGGPAGLALLNDAKSGFDVLGGEIGMTVARSPVYAWHDPEVLTDDGVYTYLDQGVQRFAYRLVPHAGDWRAARVPQLAAELNAPPTTLLETYHPGPLPLLSSYADVSSDAVLVGVLKGAEDGGALVVRAVEITGRHVDCEIALPMCGRTIPVRFAPHEVRTFLVPSDADAPVTEVNLLEWPG
ncbi:MAG TPA: glycoside hydrolase family 38 C-terminal domain-containing protein [Actinophytocola sp.]|uniref:alpha-mannosidase n=1 Tax=Actinophytocola sp. TaxID=1872138 RepID=UPI002DDCEFE3|nr:glycoside hydrolase family 38 C-terminal domain-containing protein [Actinophytocola sp.]HEV2783913.1 glycoside hydrolase family 38 C-terminal domain-containing protein [Actinophytocola sp.]